MWVSGVMDLGRYCFAVKIEDERGNFSDAVVTEPIVVTPAAKAAKGLAVESFDKDTSELVLEIGQQ